MSVGGRIIERRPFTTEDGPVSITRYWVMDRNGDETVVYAKGFHMGKSGPQEGEEIWWQSGKIYFDNDRQWLEKYSASGPAPGIFGSSEQGNG